MSKTQTQLSIFELTGGCNLSCPHCGSFCGPEEMHFLPFEEIKKLLGQVARKYGTRQTMICLTGGEPLLHPRFYEIECYSSSLGFSVGITTNGQGI